MAGPLKGHDSWYELSGEGWLSREKSRDIVSGNNQEIHSPSVEDNQEEAVEGFDGVEILKFCSVAK